MTSEPVAVISRTSPSKLIELIESPKVQLQIDNDVAYHVAMNVLHLRRFRRKSQAAIAQAMRSSQPAVARIEGGDENITLHTLRRLIDALDGRLRLSIEPKEAGLPHWGNWWDNIVGGVLLAPKWTARGVAVSHEGAASRHVAGVFTAEEGTLPTRDGTLLVNAEAAV